MLTNYSSEEIANIINLLEDIKQEYRKELKSVLVRMAPLRFKNPHTLPKLKKIQINRGLGLIAQNDTQLEKNIEEFELITGQKPIITRAKKSIAGFKIRENMKIGLTITLRGKKMYTFLTKLIFFTFAQIRDFNGLSLRSFDKAGNYSFGLKEQLVFPEIDYDTIIQIQGFTINIILQYSLPKYQSESIDKILNGMILFRFLRFPLKDSGYYNKYSSLLEIKEIWDRKKTINRKRWSQN